MAIQDELNWYYANHAELVRRYRNQWLVIRNQGVAGAFGSYGEALAAATTLFGTQSFLVKQALEQEPIQTI